MIRPRFGWKKLAACAACAALVLAAYPVYRAVNPPLHGYTVMESGGMIDTQNEMKSPGGGSVFSGEDVGDTSRGGDGTLSGSEYSAPGQDAPVQEEAAAQYQGLLRGLGGQEGREPETYPEWFAGAWIDNSYQPEAKLAVAIVDGFRTGELEAEISGWCGDGVVFESAKYSYSFLDGLMDPVTDSLDGTGLACGIGVDVAENCLGVDLYSDGADIPKEVLVKLGQLDPTGDAIRVRLFTQSMSILTDQVQKGPEGALAAPESAPAPGADSTSRIPEAWWWDEGGAQEAAQPARQVEDLPQRKEPSIESKYDAAGE